MPAVNVNIQPEIIRWALSQTQKEKLGDTLMNNIIQWLNGTKTPTLKLEMACENLCCFRCYGRSVRYWYLLTD